MTFESFIGIDYSGAKTPLSRGPALQVYEARVDREPHSVHCPAWTSRVHRNWNRREIANWLLDRLQQGDRCLVGIDHGFSFPIQYFRRYKLNTWNEFLRDFTRHWPTDQDDMYIDSIRCSAQGNGLKRTGSNHEYCLTEQWSSSAKSVFQFDVQGSVAKSTHAGIPWLLNIRYELGNQVHF